MSGIKIRKRFLSEFEGAVYIEIGEKIYMKCPADYVTACDKQAECKCGFCKEHCVCEVVCPDCTDTEGFQIELTNEGVCPVCGYRREGVEE